MERGDPLTHTGGQVLVGRRRRVGPALLEVLEDGESGMSESVLPRHRAPQLQERTALVAEGLDNTRSSILSSLAPIWCAASPIESAIATSMLSNSAELVPNSAPASICLRTVAARIPDGAAP